MLAATPCKSQYSELGRFLSENGYRSIELNRNATGHLAVKAGINDVEGFLILDTGAGCSVIDTAKADTLKLVLDTDSIQEKGVGAG